MEISKYGYWKGKPLEDYTRLELLDVVVHMGSYYEGRVHNLEIDLQDSLK